MRTTGILLPVFSLPSPYGIGTFGKEAYDFVDFLCETGQNFWQILPLLTTSYGDSPYQSPSAFAGNPYFIDPKTLVRKGYVSSADLAALTNVSGPVDYGRLYAERMPFLRRAYEGFRKHVPAAYGRFLERNADWLDDYALFMAIKDDRGGMAFTEWPDDLRFRRDLPSLHEKYRGQADFYRFLQYEFDAEWQTLRDYAKEHSIRIIGDLPIYVAPDSADVWANPEQFRLNEDLRPTLVAGVPPDAFSAEGQLWGNPLYNWELMEQERYPWWKKRMRRAFALYDKVRIDHFVGFSTYYTIPAGSDSAKNGMILRGPGYDFFREVCADVPKGAIIAEDLGELREGVAELLEKTGYPNMRVVQFSFSGDADNPHIPSNYVPNCVAYTGTHDNPTLRSFWESLSKEERKQVSRLLPKTRVHPVDRMIAYTLYSVANTVIVPLADYMHLGDNGRINAPSTAEGNWTFRLPKKYATENLRERILSFASIILFPGTDPMTGRV